VSTEPIGPGLKSKRYTLFGRLYDRYALEPPPVQFTRPPEVSTQLSPVIDVSDLYPPELEVATLNLDVATSILVVAFTVPINQRWLFIALHTEGTNANVQLVLADPAGIEVLIGAAGNPLRLTNDIAHIVIDAGWRIGLFGTDDIGDISRDITLMFRREFLN